MCGSPLTNPAGPHVEKTAPQVFIPLKGGKVGAKDKNIRKLNTCGLSFNISGDAIWEVFSFRNTWEVYLNITITVVFIPARNPRKKGSVL